MNKYIGCWFSREEAEEETGEVRFAHAFEAANEKQAKAKAALLFMETFPEDDDSHFEFRMYADADGVPCPTEEWDETFLYDHEWDEAVGHPVAVAQKPKPVDFDKLQPSVRISILVKYGTTEINYDQLAPAMELLQDDASLFDGHVVEAINKMPQISAMYPERILEAIDYVRENCATTKKWPEIKAVLVGWLKQHEKDREEGTTSTDYKPGSGDPARFDTVLALLIMGKDPAKAEASDVKNAKFIKESRDPAWRGWRTTLIGIPGIYTFPEQLLYELTFDGMKDLSLIKDSEARLAYVRDHFAGHPLLPDYIINENDSHETEQNTTASTGALESESPETSSVAPQHTDDEPATGTVETAPPVEENGPFYFLMADGEKVGRANKRPGLEKALADGGTEISQEEYQARKNGTYQAPQETAEKPAAQPEVKKIADGVFSIDNLMGEQPKAPVSVEPSALSNEVVKAEAATDSDAFVLRADELEKELGDSENLSLWKSVMRTNPRYTKDMGDLGFGGTSINAEYMFMKATESFGPAGTGWGWTIIENKMVEGAPLTEKIFEGTKFVGKRTLRDADGSLLFELNHYLRIALWYIKDGEKGMVENFGSTPYRQTTKNGIYCDSEVHKKSLTDAIKKCLSMLGFSADVWLGLYDDAAYKAESALEFGIKDAAEKADDSTRIREELDERFKQNVETMRKAVSQNEVSKIASSLTRTVGIHLKSAKEINDQEYVKYLEGRLRRLEEVKTECLTKLQEKAA